ncbi:hypothetical protein M422DRAFT_106865, partial [Sphaerobolus stellatus SS14]
HVVAIALGSNSGDRYTSIEAALQRLEEYHDVITITGTSFLYESDPMYVIDQEKFLNCAITATTNLEPLELLELLKKVEDELGRVKTTRNGPRAIDLDIIFYDSIVFDNRPGEGDGSQPGQLVIPHARLAEREFVLRPLNDLIPDYMHPSLKQTVEQLFDTLLATFIPSLVKVLPFPPPPNHRHIKPVLWPLSIKTYIMATVNTTPDSFSSAPSTEESAIQEGLAAVEAGADIIDIGGYSTRPGAELVSPEVEMERVVPVVRALRERGVTLPISIDTFRASVLRAAVEAGANCLNDVTALSGEGEEEEENMSLVAEDLGIPVIMMHSRGAHNVTLDNNYDAQGGVVNGVRQELGSRIMHALQVGMRRWNLIVDPGFGFSKTVEGNFELLRRFGEITAPGPHNARNLLHGYPTLAGLSRKGFLDRVLDKPTQPQEREWATGAGVAASIQQGADIVRVHRVAEMKDIVRVA